MKKLLLLFLCGCFALMNSQSTNTADKLLEEIQKLKQTDKNLTLVWWIPTEYWRIAVQDKNITESKHMEYLENLLNDYTIVAAGDYSLDSNDGVVEFKVNSVTNNVTFYGLNGDVISPLEDSEINGQLLTLVNNTLKPLFIQMLGKMGSGLEFFIYNNRKNGTRIINPNQSGSFKIDVKGEVFKWDLPLVSLMKEKVCPVDQAQMQGNWMYCPFHGSKL